MTIDEFNSKYGRLPSKGKSESWHKYGTAAWEIQSLYGHVHHGNMSVGRATELTAQIIDHYSSMGKEEAEASINRPRKYGVATMDCKFVTDKGVATVVDKGTEIDIWIMDATGAIVEIESGSTFISREALDAFFEINEG